MLGTRSNLSMWNMDMNGGVELTSFFLARSPEAPSNTRMLFSRISSGADILSLVLLVKNQMIHSNDMIQI